MPVTAETATALHFYLAEPNMTAGKRAYSRVQEKWFKQDEDSGSTFRSLPTYRRVREYDRTTQIIAAAEEPVDVTDVIAVEELGGATAIGEPMEGIESKPSAFDKIVAQLIRFEGFERRLGRKRCFQPNLESLKDARAFIRALAPESIVPQATLHADGTAVLLLLTNDTYVELEFPGSNMVGYFARRGSQEWNDDFSFADGYLPDALSGDWLRTRKEAKHCRRVVLPTAPDSEGRADHIGRNCLDCVCERHQLGRHGSPGRVLSHESLHSVVLNIDEAMEGGALMYTFD